MAELAGKTNIASNTSTNVSFEQFLLEHSFIAKEAYDRIVKLKGDRALQSRGAPVDVGQILISEKILEEEDLAKARAAFLNLPYIDLRKTQVIPAVLQIIPEESRNFYHMCPFELQSTNLKVAVSDPTNLQALEALEFLGQKKNLEIHIYVASITSIDTAIGRKKNLTSAVGEALEDIKTKEAVEQKDVKEVKVSKNETIEEAPIIKIVDVILSNAIEANASDIHIEPSEDDVRVRYRIDGILHTSLRLPKNIMAAIISRIKILSNMKIDEQRLPQDGRFHVDLAGKSVDLRVSTLPIMYGEKVVMRILNKTTSVPTLEQLGIRGRGLTWVQDNIKKNHGIFLITGPTGSGKSTTLYSILSLLNTSGVNIITLEDPVEYFIPGVNQSQTNADIGLTFASGLRSILRQDPNIIMVGEIRDEETAELAVHAALTGHLVFSTLHTNNSVGAVPRLIDMGIEPFLLTASLNVIMAQRLVRKLCENCKKEQELTDIIKEEVKKSLVGMPKEYLTGLDTAHYKIYQAKGCEKCGGIGYRGRFGIFEVLPLVNEIQEMFFAKASAHDIYLALAKLGMITMKQDGIVKVLRGETTMEEIIRVTTE